MNYSDLQKEAKKLGLKHVGVSRENLEKAISEAKGSKAETAVEPAPKAEPAAETPKPKTPENANTAIVSVGKHEVRRYTKKVHGEGFIILAKEFASDREGGIVKVIETKPQVKCPNCGKEFDA